VMKREAATIGAGARIVAPLLARPFRKSEY
jgi:hypothetical protein